MLAAFERQFSLVIFAFYYEKYCYTIFNWHFLIKSTTALLLKYNTRNAAFQG